MPSTPRSAVWRKLKRLEVVQLGDGLVALPADAGTLEQLEWIAEDVTDHGEEASVWLGRPADVTAEDAIIERMKTVIAAEYDAVAAEAASTSESDPPGQARAAARLRLELHRIQARDYFPTTSHDNARRAVEDLASSGTVRARL